MNTPDARAQPEVVDEKVIIEGEPVLRGTLSIPGPVRYPGLLFLAGSGPLDRDANASGVRLAIFSELATTISRLGFVTLRYDKRGIGESEGDYWSAGLWDLVGDAERAFLHLRSHPRVDPERLVILGHSEGVALAAALNRRVPAAGLILVAGTARPLREIIVWQGESLSAEMEGLPGLRGFIARRLGLARRGRREMSRSHATILASEADAFTAKGERVNAKWLREHFAYNPAPLIAEVTCPVLVVGGAKDVQVPAGEAEAIAAAVRGPVASHVIPDMNHILRLDRTVPSRLALKTHYRAISALPLHPEFVRLVSRWLTDLFA